MYTAFPISLRAGQAGVLTFAAGANTTLGTIEGALYVADPEVPDAPLPPPTPCVVQGNVLYIPALPVGLHLFEVRVGGRTAVYQHVEVLPSPLGDMPGSAAWDVLVEDVGGEWHFTISTPVGPAGAPGAPGKSAYDIWREMGNVGSEADFLDSLRGAAGQDGKSPSAEDVAAELIPRISAELACEGPAASNNWHASYFQLGENYLPQGTALSELGYRVRFDSLNGCTTDPVYLGVWELAENGVDWELRGVSTNTQVQALSSDVLWRFDPAKVRLSGRPIRCCLLASREDGWRTDLTMGVRVSSATGANTAIYYNDQSWASVPKYFLRGYKPVENITMSGGAEVEVDQQYDATSPRPQSGTAVAEALAALPTCPCGDEVYSTAELSKDWRVLNIGGFALDPEVFGGKWLRAIAWQPASDLTTSYRLQVLEVGISSRRVPYIFFDTTDMQDVGLSVKDEVLIAGTPVRYEFDPPIHISKDKVTVLRLQKGYAFHSDEPINIEITNVPSPDNCVLITALNTPSSVCFAPKIELSFVGGTARQFVEHTDDKTAHLSEEEHAQLTELLTNGGAGGGEDAGHKGRGAGSVQLGEGAEAKGSGSVVIGQGTTDQQWGDDVVIGNGAYASGVGCVIIGAYSWTGNSFAVAVGSSAQAHGVQSTALGYKAMAYGYKSTALGTKAYALNDGSLVLAAGIDTELDGYDDCDTSTQLILIAKGSPLAKKYTDGEAAIGYAVVLDAWNLRPGGGTVCHLLESGTRKLKDLLTDNKGTFDPFFYN